MSSRYFVSSHRLAASATALGVLALCTLPSPSRAQTFNVTFDEAGISTGLINDQYLAAGANFRGVRFLEGDASNGLSTTTTGSAFLGSFGTGVDGSTIDGTHGDNVLIPGLGQGNDIYVQFFNSAQQRITVSSIGIANDSQGDPQHVTIEGFNQAGVSLGSTVITGAGVSGFFNAPGGTNVIYYAKLYSTPGFGDSGNAAGYDNFRYTIASGGAAAPEPTSLALISGVLLPIGAFARRRRSRKA